MLLRLVPALTTLSNTCPNGRHWVWHFQVLQSYFQGTCLGLFMCSGPGPAVEACAVATLQSHNSYCIDPAMCTFPLVPCHLDLQQAYWDSWVSSRAL